MGAAGVNVQERSALRRVLTRSVAAVLASGIVIWRHWYSLYYRASPDGCITLNIKIAQKPYLIESLGPDALNYESFEGKG